MTPLIAAFDLSLTSTGVCIGGHTDVIRSKHQGPQRLEEIQARVLAALERGVDLVVLEGYSYASKNGAHQLGELGGVIRVGLYAAQIPYVVVAPGTRAKYATGKGNASKDLVVSEISARRGEPFATSDEVDAYVLWAMAMDAYGAPPLVLPATHRAALSAVVWPDLGLSPDLVNAAPAAQIDAD